MRPEISSEYSNNRITKEVEEQFNITADLYYRAVENADGVPYQLIFGDEIGNGFFLNPGYGIKQLFDITSGEFNEKLFQQMIKEIIPDIGDIPGDPSLTRIKIISGEIQKYKAEILITTSNGDNKWIRDCAIPVYDDKTGKATGLMGIFYDISEYKRTLLLLDKALERATESDRLKMAFLNNLSHEIRTPLNAIVGFSTLLNEPGQLMDNRLEFQDIITHSSDHLLEIVDDVVEISKIEAKAVRLIIKDTDLNQMLQRVFDRFKPAADEKNILLILKVPPYEKEIIISTDGYKLFQSLNNLVSNAVKFTIEGRVEFGCNIKGDKLEFYVFDTGIGIGREHQTNIFKPFYQAESSITKRYEGTGLGLSIARAYIELLGSEISFTSESGKGSEFCFTIPYTRK
jgi:signal transduction histidine kinase